MLVVPLQLQDLGSMSQSDNALCAQISNYCWRRARYHTIWVVRCVLSLSLCLAVSLCCLLESFLGFYTDVLNAGLSNLQSFDLATWGKRCKYFANSKFLLSLSRRFSFEVNSFFTLLLLKVWCRLLEFKFKRGSVPPEVPLTVFHEFPESQYQISLQHVGCVGGCDPIVRELLASSNRNADQIFMQQGPPSVAIHRNLPPASSIEYSQSTFDSEVYCNPHSFAFFWDYLAVFAKISRRNTFWKRKIKW